MTTITEALARANADDAESLEALCRALLRGGHGPDAARVLALLELDIMERRDTTMTLAEVQRRQAKRAEERQIEEEEQGRHWATGELRDQEGVGWSPGALKREMDKTRRKVQLQRAAEVERKLKDEMDKMLRKLSTG